MENTQTLKVADYPFEKSDFAFYFKNLYRDRGFKALYQFLNRPHRRSYSRSLIKRFAPTGVGLEIGCGERTISPTDRTILSDGYSEHGEAKSIAKVFFKGDTIPYPDGTFEFILSEHVLEHIANPIKSLCQWIEKLAVGGKLIIVLPHKERTNDCHRQVTSLEHLIKDYQNDVPYNDETHFQDWWDNVVEKDLMPEHYKHIPKDKLIDTASIHHHVWTTKEIVELFEYLGLNISHTEEKLHDRRDSFLVIGEKPEGWARPC